MNRPIDPSNAPNPQHLEPQEAVKAIKSAIQSGKSAFVSKSSDGAYTVTPGSVTWLHRAGAKSPSVKTHKGQEAVLSEILTQYLDYKAEKHGIPQDRRAQMGSRIQELLTAHKVGKNRKLNPKHFQSITQKTKAEIKGDPKVKLNRVFDQIEEGLLYHPKDHDSEDHLKRVNPDLVDRTFRSLYSQREADKAKEVYLSKNYKLPERLQALAEHIAELGGPENIVNDRARLVEDLLSVENLQSMFDQIKKEVLNGTLRSEYGEEIGYMRPLVEEALKKRLAQKFLNINTSMHIAFEDGEIPRFYEKYDDYMQKVQALNDQYKDDPPTAETLQPALDELNSLRDDIIHTKWVLETGRIQHAVDYWKLPTPEKPPVLWQLAKVESPPSSKAQQAELHSTKANTQAATDSLSPKPTHAASSTPAPVSQQISEDRPQPRHASTLRRDLTGSVAMMTTDQAKQFSTLVQNLSQQLHQIQKNTSPQALKAVQREALEETNLMLRSAKAAFEAKAELANPKPLLEAFERYNKAMETLLKTVRDAQEDPSKGDTKKVLEVFESLADGLDQAIDLLRKKHTSEIIPYIVGVPEAERIIAKIRDLPKVEDNKERFWLEARNLAGAIKTLANELHLAQTEADLLAAGQRVEQQMQTLREIGDRFANRAIQEAEEAVPNPLALASGLQGIGSIIPTKSQLAKALFMSAAETIGSVFSGWGNRPPSPDEDNP